MALPSKDETAPVQEVRTRAPDSQQDGPSALYLLNCYDIWSATPANDTGFDCRCEAG